MKHRRTYFFLFLVLLLGGTSFFWHLSSRQTSTDFSPSPGYTPEFTTGPSARPAQSRASRSGTVNLFPNAGVAAMAAAPTPAAVMSPDADSLPQLDEAVLTHSFAEWGGRKIHPTRILARLAPGMELRGDDVRLRSLNLTISHRYSSKGLVLLDAADGVTPKISGKEEAIARGQEQIARMKQLNRSGLFQYVEPDWIVHALIEPTDSAYTDGTLWGLKNTGQNFGTPGADIGLINSGAASNAWDITTGSSNVIVAIIDTGIRYTHFDLAPNIWHDPTNSSIVGINAVFGTSDPFDDNNHGTHVSGTIGAAANDGHPHVGINWAVQLMGCKFLDATGNGATSDGIKCIDFAVLKRARILSNSWGGGGFSQGLFDSILNARNHGVIFIAAAGNEGQDTDQFPAYPACYDSDNVISVAALDRNDHLASFSNFGLRTVKLGAPGVRIFSSTAGSDGEYQTFDGTSMACPHVSGVAALILARYPGIDLAELKQRLFSSAVPVAELSGKSATGGRVNAFNALTAAPDGILEVSITVSNGVPLQGGALVPIFVGVTDLSPISDATVTATGFTNLTFQNNGFYPDALAGDDIYSAVISAPRNTNSISLTFVVTAPGKSAYTNTMSFPVLLPPVNDDFIDRLVLPAGTTNASGSNVGGTKEPGEMNHDGAQGGKSVWWSWTAASNGAYTVDTKGSQFDTLLAVYTGNSVSNLTAVAADDDSGGGGISAVTFNALAGTTYQIAVDGYGGASGAISLNFMQTPPSAPVIIHQPADKTAVLGAMASFSVSVDGSFPLSYQWRFQGAPISGATNSIYSINSVTLNDAGVYSVTVSNGLGGAVSSNATLRVAQLGNGFFDDFEPDIHLTNWSAFGGSVLANKFGGSVSGINSLWFGGDGERFAVTRPINTSFGGTISFSIRLADGSAYPWETVDIPDEGVSLQYSIDGGSNWVNMAVYDTGAFYTWSLQQATIPGNALGTNTLFRWIQANNSGSFYDHWALDDVLVSASSTAHAPIIVAPPSDQTVAVGGTALFSVVVDGTSPLTFQWHLNGNDIPGRTNATLKLTNVSTNDVGTYSVTVSNFQGSVLSAGARLILVPTLGEAVNSPWLSWRTGGNASWSVETNVTHDGALAVQSGKIFSSGNPLYNQETWIETTVTGPGVVSFWWKVSSEGCYPPDNFGVPCDTLNFIVYSNSFDQITVDFMQGESNWVYRSFPVAAGQQTLRWSYKKDEYTDAGQDRAWLDQVRFKPTSLPPAFVFAGTSSLTNGQFQFTFSGDLGRDYQIETSTNLSNWLPYATFTVTNVPMIFLDVNPNSPRRFYRGKNIP